MTRITIDKGYVELVDYMGTDHDICCAARQSYGRKLEFVDADKDRKLIRYLMRHGHTSPFEMAEVKFAVKCPMDTWRQWIRHRTASVNEYSTRYSVALQDMATTDADAWRLQSENNHQGSSGECLNTDVGTTLSNEEVELQAHAAKVYEHRLELGVAKEQARKDLPLSTYTEAVWKIDLHNLMHFLKLRLAPEAQQEIREFAKAIFELVKPHFPLTFEAFEDYRLNAITFTALELKVLHDRLLGVPIPYAVVTLKELEKIWVETFPTDSLLVGVPREVFEFAAKLQRIGFKVYDEEN